MIVTENDFSREVLALIKYEDGSAYPCEIERGIGQEVITPTDLTWLDGSPALFAVTAVGAAGFSFLSNRPVGTRAAGQMHTESISYQHNAQRGVGTSVFHPITSDGKLSFLRAGEACVLKLELVRRIGAPALEGAASKDEQIAA